MKPKLITIFILIIVTPLIFLTWFGNRLVKGEHEKIKSRFNELQRNRLEDINGGIERFIKKTERDFILLVDSLQSNSPKVLREITQRNRLIRQTFLIEPGGRVSFPKVGSTNTFDEASFFDRTKSIWDRVIHFYHESEESGNTNLRYGWYTWFWGDGIHLIFWRWKSSTGHIVGIELSKIALIADIIGQLPSTKIFKSKLPNSRTVLVDEKNKVLYYWGNYRPDKKERPKAMLAVNEPLNAWSLKFFAHSDILKELDSGITFNIITSILIVTIALVALSYYFYRENARELNEGAQKVSFVNKVSHELKTPLTNIRMYAEFLDETDPNDEQEWRGYIGIIISECQRLSRLIHNVLTFAEKQKDGILVNKSLGNVDSVIHSVIESFRLPLEAKNINVESDLQANKSVYFDEDILKQILGNLISNVEKYGSLGKYLRIQSRLDGNKTIISVSDKGPGIPKDKIEDVFKLFVRLSDKLTDGITGTGIGLSISRDFARLHGGELTAKSSQTGTCLLLELHTPGGKDENTSGRR